MPITTGWKICQPSQPAQADNGCRDGVRKRQGFFDAEYQRQCKFVGCGDTDKINDLTIKEGHRLVKKQGEGIYLKADTYVLETNVHFQPI